MVNDALARRIQQAAIACGFDGCGILSLEKLEGYRVYLKERMRKAPASAPFYTPIEEKINTKDRFPWAKAMIVCVDWYGKYRFPEELQGKYAKSFFLGHDKSHEQGCDLRSFEAWFDKEGIRCEGGEQFGHFSVGPLRHAAMMAGLGIIRKNNFFYTEKGSFVNLFGYVIDRECELIQENNLKPCSPKCTLCQQACKTKALFDAYTMDPMKCVSLWTTFGKGFVPPYLKEEAFEQWICGCDNCQDACPYNRKQDWNTGKSFSDLEDIAPDILPEKFSNLSDEYLIEHIIPKTDNHLKPSDVSILRRNAERASRYHRNGQK